MKKERLLQEKPCKVTDCIQLDSGFLIEIITKKTDRGLQSFVTVAKSNGFMKEFRMFHDFYKVYLQSDKRATKKTILDMQDSLNIEEILKEIKSFYLNKNENIFEVQS